MSEWLTSKDLGSTGVRLMVFDDNNEIYVYSACCGTGLLRKQSEEFSFSFYECNMCGSVLDIPERVFNEGLYSHVSLRAHPDSLARWVSGWMGWDDLIVKVTVGAEL